MDNSENSNRLVNASIGSSITHGKKNDSIVTISDDYDDIEKQHQLRTTFINNLKKLLDVALNDIQNASNGGAKLGAFILSASFIETIAGFNYGRDSERQKNDKGKHIYDGYIFGLFIKNHMSRYYNCNKKIENQPLWVHFRCGLIHSYSCKNTYVFTHNEKDGKHFEKTPKEKKIILNLESFIEDIRIAYEELLNKIENDDEAYIRAKKRFESLGIMMEIPIDQL